MKCGTHMSSSSFPSLSPLKTRPSSETGREMPGQRRGGAAGHRRVRGRLHRPQKNAGNKIPKTKTTTCNDDSHAMFSSTTRRKNIFFLLFLLYHQTSHGSAGKASPPPPACKGSLVPDACPKISTTASSHC